MVNFGHARDQYPTGALIESYIDREGRGQASDHRHPDARRPPLPIDEGLRRVCHIPGHSFFVAATQDNGELIYFYAPSGLTSMNPRRFFDETAFHLEVNRAQNGGNASHGNPLMSLSTEMSGFDSGAGQPATSHELTRSTTINSAPGLTGDSSKGVRRRQRARETRRGDVSTLERPRRSPGTGLRKIAISDDEAVWAFYERRFRECQQTACKLIAKAWIKAVEPKKQTTHPYTRGEEGKPDWWPMPWGPQPTQRVIHKEPDHIPKAARVRLLVHILRMVVEPQERQHPAVLRVRLNIDKLKVITFDALSGWFADVDHPANEQKRRFVVEIFKVAYKEEEYKNGEIDGITEVYVMNENGVPPDGDESDNEELDNMPTSTRVPPLRQNDQVLMPHVYGHNHTESGHSTPKSYATSVTMRDDPYEHATFSSDFSSPRPNYVHGVNLLGQGSNYVQEHMDISDVHSIAPGESRRPSLFSSDNEYPTSWPGSNAPDAQSMYAFPTHDPNAQNSFEMPNTTAYLGHAYEGLPRQESNNAAHGPSYTSPAIKHETLPTQPPYHNYAPEGNGS
ncbi:hypothetical protein GGR57DRAFT_5969 [Xylariaceae sp. FL1272]|nr:hypothetical protein GGR57DRAFT_5969 [Xylariaceae sp. FL1272]